VRALVDGAEPAKLSVKGIVRLCASLPRLDYLQKRKAHAKSAGIPVGELDREVDGERARIRRRAEIAEGEGSGSKDDGIDQEPVSDLAAVLDTARVEIARYVVADDWQLDTLVLWGAHSHFVHHPIIDIEISPRLLLDSVAPDSGKTTTLELTGNLVARPLEANSFSAAAFYRLADTDRPTLLLDEIQGVLRRNNPEVEAILLSSHRRASANVLRSVQDENDDWITKQFSAWCTYAATVHGRLSPAMLSRCLVVMLRRAKPGEVKEHARNSRSPVLLACGRKFARWARDQLDLPDVDLPKALHNRAGDNWRPLFQIAARAGGQWPDKVREAALAAVKAGSSPATVTLLLYDIRAEMGERDWLSTRELLQKLRSKQDASADWNTANRGSQIDSYWLRTQLRDVLPKPRRPPKRDTQWRSVHGYFAEEFTDAYERYLSGYNLNEYASEATEPGEHTPSADPTLSGRSGRSELATETSSNFQDSCTSGWENPSSGRHPDGSCSDHVEEGTSGSRPDEGSRHPDGGNIMKLKGKLVERPDRPDRPDEVGRVRGKSELAAETAQPNGEEVDEIW
jgi:putative DNA primase/helicase